METNIDSSIPTSEIKEPNYNDPDLDVKEYIKNLLLENLRLRKKINKLFSDISSYHNDIKAKEELISELSKKMESVHIYIPNNSRDEPIRDTE